MTQAQPAPPSRRPRRAGRIALGVAVAVVLLVGGLVWYALSESGLPFLVARVVAQSGGRLSIEGASGSIGSTMRFARLAWNGSDTTVEATDVVVEWRPQALWNSRIDIAALGAGRVSIAMKPSSGATTPPTDLALPLAVDLERVAVTTLTVRAGPRVGTITGLAFAYHGDATAHSIEGLRLVSDYGALSGDLSIGATAPLPVKGKLSVAGDGPLAGARLDTAFAGTLAALRIDAQGAFRGADLTAQAAITPFASAPLASATLDLRHVDASAYDASLPSTDVEVHAEVQPSEGGFAGTARVVNQVPGTLDAGRLPFRAIDARYRWHPAALDLDALTVELPGRGRASGRGHVPLGEPPAPSTWMLTLTDVDPALLHARLVHARVSGRVEAQIEGSRQVIAGTLADAGRELRFAATVADRRLDLARASLRTGGGRIEGRGTLALEGNNAFDAHLVATRFDPSQIVAGAHGALDGTVDVRGTLRPSASVQASAIVKPGSRYGALAVAGSAHAAIAWPRVRDVDVDATVGTAHVTARGDAGAVGDALAFTLDADRLADLAPLLPAAAFRPTRGSAHARGTVRIEPGGVGGEVHWSSRQLALADGTTAAVLDVDATVAPGGGSAHPVPASARAFDVTARGNALALGDRPFDDVAVDVRGTLAQHALSLRGRGAGVTLAAGASGSATLARELAASSWSGRIESLEASGALVLRLRAPAQLSLARERIELRDAHLEVADGRADVALLRVAGGRVDTQGSFSGVPLTSVLKLAGRSMPLASDLTLGGEWSIAATPRLNGRFSVHREQGDLYGSETLDGGGLAFGLTALEASGTLHDDALAARAVMRSSRAGNAQGELALASITGAAEGHLASTAPLTASLDADLPSLAALQPLIGTQAVVTGRLSASLRAHGTLGDPLVSGSVSADALRIDAPQYGVHMVDGRARAQLADGVLTLSELSFRGGDGTFTAHGTLVQRGRDAGSRVTWHAEQFRVTDRPDFKLVVAGDGTLAMTDKHLALAGQLKIVEGHVEYESSPPGRLGPDVVVKGREPDKAREAALRELPLTLDLDVDMPRLTFYGEGIDATLAGRMKITTGPTGALRGRGTIRTVFGTYYAFGQKLTIDRGRLIFDGPLDDPALDVVALRKNLAVEAGIALTGTVKVPRVRITSNPPVPENEALAWLITGQGLSGAGRTDYAALGAASAALLGRQGKPITTRIAEEFGLDDISLESSGTATGTSSNPVSSQVVVFGKRISDRLTLGYEQGLALASGALRLEYALTRTLTVRAEAGAVSALGLFYRRSFR
ncbi:MAG TPA: translocation/assembly module TamB domain-containing protein [Casimicrobiaceae bacterium]|jgi:translocation and assembly module TamB